MLDEQGKQAHHAWPVLTMYHHKHTRIMLLHVEENMIHKLGSEQKNGNTEHDYWTVAAPTLH